MKDEITDWQVGTWTVQPSLNQIKGPQGSFRTTPKIIATLLCLAKHQGEVVSRDTLLSTVWSGTVVSDDSLNKAISEIRSIFDDNPQEARVIETIRQRGYRLLLPAQPILKKTSFSARKPVPPRRSFGWKVYGSLTAVALLLCVLALSWTNGTDPILQPAYRAVPITTQQGFEFDVALSHDGQQIAYAHFQEEVRQVDLYVKQIGLETPEKLTDNGRIEMSPSWSPDGRSIAFLAWDQPNESCGLYVIALLGGEERKIADCETFLVTGVSWSPDGKHIAFSDRTNREEPFRIYLVDIETRSITQITDPPSDLFGDFSATFSPDGKSIGFIRGTVAVTTALLTTPAVGDVYTIRLDDLAEQRLTFENQEIPHIDWMPEGHHIVFASNRERGAPGLWKVNVHGGTPEWLFGSNTFVRKPMFSRSNKRLVFEQWDNEASVWHIDLDSLKQTGQDAAQPLIQSTHYDVTPQYSPDGQYLAFTSERSGSSEIWVSEANGDRLMQLTSFGGPFTSSPRWSPDGTRLTFETRIEGQTDIYTVGIAGGLPKRLTHHSTEDMVPNWSQDSAWIYFASNRTGEWQIWKKPSDGNGKAVQVTTNGGFLPVVSPNKDDASLYYTRIDKEGLYRMPLEGGAEELILPELREDDWGNWTATDQGIYALLRAPSQIVFLDVATLELTPIGALRNIPAGMIGITVSADNKTLAFVQQRHRGADVWMIDNV